MVRAVMAMNPKGLIPSPPDRHCLVPFRAIKIAERGRQVPSSHGLLSNRNGRSDPISHAVTEGRELGTAAAQGEAAAPQTSHVHATGPGHSQTLFDDIIMGSPKHTC